MTREKRAVRACSGVSPGEWSSNASSAMAQSVTPEAVRDPGGESSSNLGPACESWRRLGQATRNRTVRRQGVRDLSQPVGSTGGRMTSIRLEKSRRPTSRATARGQQFVIGVDNSPKIQMMP